MTRLPKVRVVKRYRDPDGRYPRWAVQCQRCWPRTITVAVRRAEADVYAKVHRAWHREQQGAGR